MKSFTKLSYVFWKLKVTEAVCALHFHTKSVGKVPLSLSAELGYEITVTSFGHYMLYENPKLPTK